MLTIRRTTVSVDDRAGAWVAARDLLDDSLSPRTLSSGGEYPDTTPHALWVGSAKALERFGVQRGAEVPVEQLAFVLQGRHATTWAQVRQPIPKSAPDERGRTVSERVVETFELPFEAPQSVSWVWAQADAELRAQVARAMYVYANAALAYLTQVHPVAGGDEPAREFAAVVVLHVTVRSVPEQEIPPPLLHTHCHLVGLLDVEGTMRNPDAEVLHGEDRVLYGENDEALFEHGMLRECGAVGLVELSTELRRIGFQIEAMKSRGGHHFEIVGVPEGLLRPGVWENAEC